MENRCVTPACAANTCAHQPPVVAMAYVPWQRLERVYDSDKAFCRGTLFPELDKPFMVGGRGHA